MKKNTKKKRTYNEVLNIPIEQLRNKLFTQESIYQLLLTIEPRLYRRYDKLYYLSKTVYFKSTEVSFQRDDNGFTLLFSDGPLIGFVRVEFESIDLNSTAMTYTTEFESNVARTHRRQIFKLKELLTADDLSWNNTNHLHRIITTEQIPLIQENNRAGILIQYAIPLMIIIALPIYLDSIFLFPFLALVIIKLIFLNRKFNRNSRQVLEQIITKQNTN